MLIRCPVCDNQEFAREAEECPGCKASREIPRLGFLSYVIRLVSVFAGIGAGTLIFASMMPTGTDGALVGILILALSIVCYVLAYRRRW